MTAVSGTSIPYGYLDRDDHGGRISRRTELHPHRQHNLHCGPGQCGVYIGDPEYCECRKCGVHRRAAVAQFQIHAGVFKPARCAEHLGLQPTWGCGLYSIGVSVENWLTIGDSLSATSLITTTPGSFSVATDVANLSPGTFTGNVRISWGTAGIDVPVTIVVIWPAAPFSRFSYRQSFLLAQGMAPWASGPGDGVEYRWRNASVQRGGRRQSGNS